MTPRAHPDACCVASHEWARIHYGMWCVADLALLSCRLLSPLSGQQTLFRGPAGLGKYGVGRWTRTL
jgi:hypothetical protein